MWFVVYHLRCKHQYFLVFANFVPHLKFVCKGSALYFLATRDCKFPRTEKLDHFLKDSLAYSPHIPTTNGSWHLFFDLKLIFVNFICPYISYHAVMKASENILEPKKFRLRFKKPAKGMFWAWIAYQTVKGTMTTSLIWVPLLYAWFH